MAHRRWLTSDEQRAWRAYVQAMHRLFSELDSELQRQIGIPLAYYEILVALSEAPMRRLRMSELADRTLFSKSRLSHAIARLEGEGWVERVACPTDGRGSFAVLTESGHAKLVAAAPEHVDGVRRHLFDRLSSEQVAQLEEISQAVAVGADGCPRS